MEKEIGAIIEEHGVFGDRENNWGYQIRLKPCGNIFYQNSIFYMDNHYVIMDNFKENKNGVVGVGDTKEEADRKAYKYINGTPRQKALDLLERAGHPNSLVDKTKRNLYTFSLQ